MIKILPLDKHYLRLAKKPVSGSVVYLNSHKQVLLVKLNYRDFWAFPGGSAEDMESSYQCASREVSEELGVSFPVKQLLIIEYEQFQEKMDFLSFIFYGGILSDEQIAKIKVQKEEIDDFDFFDFDKVETKINPRKKHRTKYIEEAIDTKQIIYLENGKKVWAF